MSAEYEAACEVRDAVYQVDKAITALDDEGRALDRACIHLDRIATCLEIETLQRIVDRTPMPATQSVKDFRDQAQRRLNSRIRLLVGGEE